MNKNLHIFPPTKRLQIKPTSRNKQEAHMFKKKSPHSHISHVVGIIYLVCGVPDLHLNSPRSQVPGPFNLKIYFIFFAIFKSKYRLQIFKTRPLLPFAPVQVRTAIANDGCMI
jgi:hypothetical protein